MSHEFGGRRPPETWASQHDRARVRLSERMVEPLDTAEAAWLDGHLLECAACREIDAAYRRDRELLRGMRVIPPPRDLWARTSAALDAESARAQGRRSFGASRLRPSRAASGPSYRRSGAPRWAPFGAVGAIAAVAVVGFLLGNMLIAAPATPSQIARGSSPAGSPGSVPSPSQIAQADVTWVTTDSSGTIVIKKAPVGAGCKANDQSACVPIDTSANNVVSLPVKPQSVHLSPTSGQMIVIGPQQGQTGLSMYVLNVDGQPSPSASPDTSSPSVGPSVSPTVEPSRSAPRPSDTTVPSTSPGGSPTPSPRESPKPPASATPNPSPTVSIIPNVTPPPSAATLIAIASGLAVLSADTAAYSADGTWFAFTARALGDPSGSDIYVWHTGDAQATAVTTDGRSVFAGWLGNRLVGSRADPPATETGASPSAPAPDATTTSPSTSADASPSATSSASAASPEDSDAASPSASADASATPPPPPGESTTSSFLIDPASHAVTPLATAAWRPAVDPTHRSVVYWEGTVAVDPVSGGWRTATGRLVISAWSVFAGTAGGGVRAAAQASPTASVSAAATATPDASTSPVDSSNTSASPSSASTIPASPTPAAAGPTALPDDIASAAGVDWAVAWDADGTHLAVWIGDPNNPTIGHLDLLGMDGSTGLPSATDRPIQHQAALPGFSLADGDLAWATPPGQDGNGSSLKVFAYTGANVGLHTGKAQTGTDQVIVVQH